MYDLNVRLNKLLLHIFLRDSKGVQIDFDLPSEVSLVNFDIVLNQEWWRSLLYLRLSWIALLTIKGSLPGYLCRVAQSYIFHNFVEVRVHQTSSG